MIDCERGCVEDELWLEVLLVAVAEAASALLKKRERCVRSVGLRH